MSKKKKKPGKHFRIKMVELAHRHGPKRKAKMRAEAQHK